MSTSVVVQADKNSKLWDAHLKVTDKLTVLFPFWTVLFAGLALVHPDSIAWAIFMLSMGITLTLDDFTRIAKQPAAVFVGFILYYALMLAFGLGLGRPYCWFSSCW